MGQRQRGRPRKKKRNSPQSLMILSKFLSFIDDVDDNPEFSSPSCLICSKSQTKMKDEDEESRKDTNSIADLLYFVCVQCLGVENLTKSQIQDKLMSSAFDELFCEQHIQLLQRGLELVKLIEEMMSELEIIKKSVKEQIEDKINCKNDLKEQEETLDVKIESVDEVDFDFCEIDPLFNEEYHHENDQSTSKNQIDNYDDDLSMDNQITNEIEMYQRRSSRKMQLLQKQEEYSDDDEAKSGSNMDEDVEFTLKQELEDEVLLGSEDESDDESWNNKNTPKRRSTRKLKTKASPPELKQQTKNLFTKRTPRKYKPKHQLSEPGQKRGPKPNEELDNQVLEYYKSVNYKFKLTLEHFKTQGFSKAKLYRVIKGHKKYTCNVCRLTYNSFQERNDHRLAEHVPPPNKTVTDGPKPHEELSKKVIKYYKNVGSNFKQTWNHFKNEGLPESTIYEFIKPHLPRPGVLKNPQKVQEIKQYLEANPNSTLLAAARKLKIGYKTVSKVKIQKLGMTHCSRAELTPLGNEESHPCPLCDRVFRDKSYVQDHLSRVHSGKRDHICSMCARSFKKRSHLRRHEALHSKPNFKTRGIRRTNLKIKNSSYSSQIQSQKSTVMESTENCPSSSSSSSNSSNNNINNNLNYNANTLYSYESNNLYSEFQ